MKTYMLAGKSCIVALALFAFGSVAARTQEIHSMDYYLVQDGQLMLMKGGQSQAMEKEVTLANNFKLLTNGTLILKPGVEKTLKPNQRVTTDGFWMAANGQLTALEDHLGVINGKLVNVNDGVAQPVTQVLKLADGSSVTPEGEVQRPDGTRIRLLDGQMIKPQGAILPAVDHVMAKKGQLLLQKDGDMLTLSPSRSMVMSDGTKVMGDGTIVKTDGTRFVLKVGQRISLPGAAVSKPR